MLLDDDAGGVDLISDQLPMWKVQCRETPGPLPGQYLTSILQWLCPAEQLENGHATVSDLECLFILLENGDFAFPFQLNCCTNRQLKHVAELFQPTIVMLLRPLQQALQQLASLFPNTEPSRPAKELLVCP